MYIDGKQATGEKCEDKTHSFTAQDHPRLCFRGNTSTLSNRDSQRHDLSPAIDGKPSGLATTAPLHEATSANRKSHSWPVVVTSQHQSQSSTMSSGYSTHTSSAVVCPCSCHRACCTSTAVQTDHLNVEHQETSSGAEAPSSGVAPSHSAQCLTLNANFPSTDTAICKNKSWSLQQELNNHRTGSYSTSSSDGESQVKDKDKDSTSVKSWNFDGLDAILSTNLLKECYSAVGKANHNVVEPQLSDDIIMKIVKQGEQVQKENCKANLIVPIKQSFSFPMIRKSMTKDEEESSLRSTSAVPSSKSVDVYVRQREPSIDFNMLTEELRKDKSLPSQIWSKQAEVLHEIIEKSKIEVKQIKNIIMFIILKSYALFQMSRVARVKKRFRRAARRIKKGVSSALKKIVCF